MTKKELVAKKAFYEAKRVELFSESHEDEIIEKVDEFRRQKEQEINDFDATLRAEFAAQKEVNIKKVNNYLELLDELINDATLQELNAQEINTTEQDESISST